MGNEFMNTEEYKEDNVKGKKLTDKEYWRMMFYENVKSEIAVNKILKILNLK